MADDDMADLRDSIADIVVAWAQVESSLTATLSNCIGEPENSEMAAAILFAPTSIEARLDIASRALSVALKGLPDETELRDTAARIFKRLVDSKRVRNAVLHGDIASVGIGDRTAYNRITPNAYDRIGMEKQWKSRQVPGYGAADIRQSARAVQMQAGKILYLGNLVTAWRTGNTADYATWLADLRR